MTNGNFQEYNFGMESLLLHCNKPFYFSSKDTHMKFLPINVQNKRHVNMNQSFQVVGLLRSCLVSPILTPFALRPPRGGGHSHIGSYYGYAARMGEFSRPKTCDGYKFLTKNLRMGHNFDIILPGNGWFSSKLNKTYCSLVNFYCK